MGLRPFDVVLIDGSGRRSVSGSTPSAATVAGLRGLDLLVLAFLPIGTVHPDRPYAARLPRDALLGPVAGTEERHVNLRSREASAVLLAEVDRLAAAGFDGICAGGLEAVHALPGGPPAAIRLLNAVAAHPGDLLLVLWNGIDFARTSIDALVQERVFLPAEAHTPRERRTLVRRLRRFRATGQAVFDVEYAPPRSRAAREAVRQALAEGFRPAVTVTSLDRPPHALAPLPGEEG
jgi:endo-alpha-1,4-polygalactosaminidase (GH114 family)